MDKKITCQDIYGTDNEESKEVNRIGLVIPEECGKAEKYDFVAIIYHDENSTQEEEEYQVFITEKDLADSKAYTTIHANMNPEIVLYPDDDHEGVGCLEYDLVQNERIKTTKEGIKAIIVSTIVDSSDSKWKVSGTVSSDYITIVPRKIREDGNELTIE